MRAVRWNKNNEVLGYKIKTESRKTQLQEGKLESILCGLVTMTHCHLIPCIMKILIMAAFNEESDTIFQTPLMI